MDNKEKLHELHKEVSNKFDEYIKAKGEVGKEHQDKIQKAKADWQNAWNKLMEVLMVLENLEI
jgi:hypothetical protein